MALRAWVIGLVLLAACAQQREATVVESPPLASAGGEAPAARNARLIQERRELHVGRKIAFAAVGAGVAAAGVGVAIDAVWFHYRGCDSFGVEVECADNTVKGLAIASGVLVAAGGVMLAIALPRLFDTLQRNRKIGRELKVLRNTQLSMGVGGSLGLSWRAAF